MVTRVVVGRAAAVMLLLASTGQSGRAQNAETGESASVADRAPPVLAATFDGQRITSIDVARILAVLIRGRSYAADALPALQAQALELAIDRRLVQRYVARATGGVDDAQIEAALASQQRQLEKSGIGFDEYLQKAGLSEEDVRQQHAWNLAWNKYLQRTVSDAAVHDFFGQHRAEYDGTTVRVRHILLRSAGARRQGKTEAVQQQAAELRSKIIAKEITFEEAARKFSAGPSRGHGGDLGFMTRHGQMVEPFAKAAFQLQPGEISQPVVTNFGVHLIQCVEIRSGDLDLDEIDEEQREKLFALLRSALTAETYTKITKLQRNGLEIDYAEDFPHFKPGTQELATQPSAAPSTAVPAGEPDSPRLDP